MTEPSRVATLATRERNQKAARDARQRRAQSDDNVTASIASSTDLPQPSSPAPRSPFPASPSSRAPQLFASLAATWAARFTRSPTELNVNLTTTLRSILAMSKRIPDSTLHQHENIAIEALQLAVAPPTPVPTPAVATAQPAAPSPSSPDSAAAAAGAAAPSAAPPAVPADAVPVAPYTLPLHLQHLFLRLLRLQLTRLPAYYRKLGSSFEARNEVPPPALGVPAYLSFVDRAHAVCGAMLNKHLPLLNTSPSTIPLSPPAVWAELLVPLAFHLQLMSFPSDPAAFSQRAVVDLFEGSVGFVRALWKYPACEDVFLRLVALMEGAPSEHTEWMRRMTLKAVRAWRCDDAAIAPDKAISLNEPHDPSFVVRSAPPSIQQHSVMMNLMILLAGSLRTHDRKHPGTEEETPQSILFVREMLAECKSMFKLFTMAAKQPFSSAASSSSSSSASDAPSTPLPHRHRSLLPLFALLGLAQSLEDVVVPEDEEVRGPLQLVRSVRAEVRSMLGSILRFPEVVSMAQGDRGWPCINALGAACPSCLFVWVASVAIVHATQRDASLITLNSGAPGPLLLRACWVTLRSFLQICDVSWLLHGSIQPAAKEPITPPPTPAEPVDSSAALSTSATAPVAVPKPPRKSFPLDTARLLQLNAWLRSSFYLLLPHYSRSLGILLIALNDRPAQTLVLSVLWQRVKYIHLVWRWYAVQESASPRKPKAASSDASQRQAQERLKRIATMQPVKPAENLFDSAAPSSGPSAPLKIVPIRLPALLLNRAQSTLVMSVVSVLARLASSPAWSDVNPAPRPYLGSPDDEAPEFDSNRIQLYSSPGPSTQSHGPEEKRGTVDFLAASERLELERQATHARTLHAFQVALILDVMGLLDFARPPNFAPFEQLLKVVSAISCGEVVPGEEKTIDDTQWLLQVHEIEDARARQQFGRRVMEIFVRCFLNPDINDPVDPSAASPLDSVGSGERLPLFLGMEQQTEAVELNFKRFADPNHGRGTIDSIATMLAQSGVLFAPSLFSSPALAVLDPFSTPWPALCRTLLLRPTSVFAPLELGWASRNFFLAGVFRRALGAMARKGSKANAASQGSIPFDIAFHYLLPWSFSLLQHPQPDLNVRIQDLFAEIWRSGYLRATQTDAAANDVLPLPSSSSIAPLPPAPSGAALEAFLRSLLPFWLQTVLSLYPKILPNRAVVDVFVSVCSALPATDMALLASLEMVRTRAAQMITALLRNEKIMKSWRAVMDGIDSGVEDAEATGVPVHAPPEGVAVPADFPRESFAKVRSLLLLYCHLMQSLDGSLFPLALAGLDDLLVRTLSPALHPLCTPLRASVASLIHASLVHSFDLTKREQAVCWYLSAVERLNIPIGIKQPEALVVPQSDRKRSVLQRFEEISQRVEERAAAAQAGPFRTDR